MEAFQVKCDAKAVCICKNEAVLTDSDGNQESPLAPYCVCLEYYCVQHCTHTLPCTNKLSADICIQYLEKQKEEIAMPTLEVLKEYKKYMYTFPFLNLRLPLPLSRCY